MGYCREYRGEGCNGLAKNNCLWQLTLSVSRNGAVHRELSFVQILYYSGLWGLISILVAKNQQRHCLGGFLGTHLFLWVFFKAICCFGVGWTTSRHEQFRCFFLDVSILLMINAPRFPGWSPIFFLNSWVIGGNWCGNRSITITDGSSFCCYCYSCFGIDII